MINFYTFEMSRTRETQMKPMPRRDFLRLGIGAASGAALSPWLQACAQLDRMIVGDGSDETQAVMIIGAGLSGLTAARELKKLGIPFRVFEASNRIGGRAFTVDEFNVASQSVDLGAEWISVNDDFVLNLCRELRVGTGVLTTESRSPQFRSGSQWIEMQSLVRDLKIADRKILDRKDKWNDSQWDAISAEELLTEVKSILDERSQLWLRRMIQLEWGCEAVDISALSLFDRFGTSPTGWKRALDKRVRVRGGVGNVTQALYDKVAGVVPGRYVLFDHKLKEISESGNQLKMEFETKDGTFNISARVVICTLPFSVMRDVKGIDEIGFSAPKVKAIRELGYGSHGKMLLSFKEKFWQNKAPIWTGELKNQWIWESGVESGPMNLGYRGILSSQVAGKLGQNIGLQSIEELKEDMRKINPSIGVEESSQVMNWFMNPFSKGSVSLLKPGQVHALSSTLVTPERQGTFIFAGEHSSLSSMGTMNGAIESGIRAAIEASHFKNEFGKKGV